MKSEFACHTSVKYHVYLSVILLLLSYSYLFIVLSLRLLQADVLKKISRFTEAKKNVTKGLNADKVMQIY